MNKQKNRVVTISTKAFYGQEASRVLNDAFDSERKKMKRTVKGKNVIAGTDGMVFCPNCSGSGKYFDGNRGVGACRVCGGFGLVRTERHPICDASGKIVVV